MKVNYFGYYLKNTNTGKSVLFDLRNLLKEYCKLNAAKFKNNFSHNDEKLYLLHSVSDAYLFLMTRSNELIRKVNTNDITVGEIKNLLDQNEQLGFASYILFKENAFGFGSTLLAPKVDVFSKYINDLLEALGITEWRFVSQALLYQATKEEALSFEHVGRTTIELSKENSFIKDILATVSADSTDTFDLDGIEIIIKPKKRKNIKETVDKFLKAIPDEGVEKMIMKARAEGASQMTDLYIVGRGAISDSVDKSKEPRIPNLLEEKYDKNKYLKVKIKEFIANENFENDTPDSVLRFNNTSAWSELVSTIQQTDDNIPRSINEPS